MKNKKLIYVISFCMTALLLLNIVSAEINLTGNLVDVNDTTNGINSTAILPNVYYGTLNFFSQSLMPIIYIGFTLFFVLILIGIGLLIKAIFIKVGDLGR